MRVNRVAGRYRLPTLLGAVILLVVAACSSTIAGRATPLTQADTAAPTTGQQSSPSGAVEDSQSSEGDGPSSSSVVATRTPSVPRSSTVRIGLDTSQFSSYNLRTVGSFTEVGRLILAPILPSLAEVDETGAIVPVEGMGTYQVVSTEPYVIEYNLTGRWSDGVPITFADFLLGWFADGSNLTNTDGTAFTGFDEDGWGLVEEPDEADLDATNFRLTFSRANPYNELLIYALVPAHVVFQQAGISPDEFAKAVKARDIAALETTADFYSGGWDIPVGVDVDVSLMLSAGPYKISEIRADGTVILTQNEQWDGPVGDIQRVEFVPVVGNAELAAALDADQIDVAAADLADPKQVVETLGQLDATAFTSQAGFSNLAEHLQFNFVGTFSDPALRQAFVACVPREQMLDELIRPIDPSAEVTKSAAFEPWSVGYSEYVKNSPWSDIALDIAGSKALLEKAGKVGQAVTLTTSTSPRRQRMAELIKTSCDQAGFSVTVDVAEDIFTEKLPSGRFEVAMYGWEFPGGFNDTSYNFVKGGVNNSGNYDNPQVAELYDTFRATSDAGEYAGLLAQIDEILRVDLPLLPLFAVPDSLHEKAGLTGPALARNGIFTGNIPEWTWD